jgi:sphingosine kinase
LLFLLASFIVGMHAETLFQGHAKDLAKSFDLSQFDGIVCVSGDGVLVEVKNKGLTSSQFINA